MRLAFTIPNDQKYKEISKITHEEMLFLVKRRDPKATGFENDTEIGDLHDP